MSGVVGDWSALLGVIRKQWLGRWRSNQQITLKNLPTRAADVHHKKPMPVTKEQVCRMPEYSWEAADTIIYQPRSWYACFQQEYWLKTHAGANFHGFNDRNHQSITIRSQCFRCRACLGWWGTGARCLESPGSNGWVGGDRTSGCAAIAGDF